MIRERHIDILINLNGYFGRSRNGVFKLRPAPLQVNFLGFPGTLGDKCMDYIVADDCVLPVSSQNFYCEKVLYMPDTYQPNDKSRKMSDRVYTRNELGLPDDGFVYCCFNNNYKITPQIFESWMRILNKVKGSVLWLLEDNPSASRNLKASAKVLGVDPDRLIFAKRVRFEDHLSRHSCADLFLDTLPYNAHTTASDALWAGLPVLTIKGNTFPGRVASSLLESLNLNELVVNSFDDYESKAVKLASDKEMYSRVRSQLKSNIESGPLFNADLYAVNFENILLKIYQQHVNKLPPIHM
jgi:predicted O-linked N-acetylglucosamine transferase (SPINDLY family)